MKLIVGLGNPGKEYAGTRHNVGFAVVEALADGEGASWKKDAAHHATLSKITLNDIVVTLARPTTFMNLSGQAVSALAKYYKIKTDEILIIQDELDLAPGAFTFTLGGRAAGHHGIESIQEYLPDEKIARLRIGVGKPTRGDGKDWVLGKPKSNEAEALVSAIDQAVEAATDWVALDLKTVMSKWNSKKTINQ
ncbi:MAG: aminoacyl-tRNA hydrolase [Patescibacteria group bacterium]